jgi:hypothetical protein
MLQVGFINRIKLFLFIQTADTDMVTCVSVRYNPT